MANLQTEVLTNPCEETNDDDEFGEFTSALSLTPSSTDNSKTQSCFPSKNGFPITQSQFTTFQPHLSQLTTNPGIQPVFKSEVSVNPIPYSDEEFGDFCREPSVTFDNQNRQVPDTSTQSESHTNVFSLEESAKFQPNYNIDLDTDTALTQLSWNSVHSSDETSYFATAEKYDSQPLSHVSTESSRENEPRDSHIESDPPPSLFVDANPIDASSDDEFGEFTHASSQIIADNFEPEQDVSLSIQGLEQTQVEEGPSEAVDDCFSQIDPTYSAPVSDIPFEPQLDWAELYTSNIDPVPDTLNVAEDDDTEDQQILEEVNQQSLEVLPEVVPEVLPEIVPEVLPEVDQVVEVVPDDGDDADDDFGDFAHFQVAPAIDEDAVDDEFDDFEVAVAVESEENDKPVAAGSSHVELSPEHKIQQLLSSIFPFESPSELGTDATESDLTESDVTDSKMDPSWKVPPPQLIDNSDQRVVWSCIKEVELTPALSFQWRHSASHQRFLSSLRIDSQSTNSMGAARWHSWSSSIPAPVNPSVVSSSSSSSSSNSSNNNSNSNSNSNSSSNSSNSSVLAPTNGTSVPVTLDLDFFLSGSSSTTTSAITPSNLLESIEKEILSAAPATPTKDKMVVMSSSTSAHQLDDIFDHLQLQDCGSAASVSHCQGNAIDLLQ